MPGEPDQRTATRTGVGAEGADGTGGAGFSLRISPGMRKDAGETLRWAAMPPQPIDEIIVASARSPNAPFLSFFMARQYRFEARPRNPFYPGWTGATGRLAKALRTALASSSKSNGFGSRLKLFFFSRVSFITSGL